MVLYGERSKLLIHRSSLDLNNRTNWFFLMNKIIKLNKSHIGQLADIDYECEHPVDIQRNLSKSEMKKYIIKRFNKKRELFFGYKETNKLVGYITLIPYFPGYKHCEVYWLAVKKKFQKRGIGKELMKFIEKYAKKNRFRKVCLYTGEEMKEAQKFYEKIGYKFVNKFPEYYGYRSGNTTAILYAKKI